MLVRVTDANNLVDVPLEEAKERAAAAGAK
jgi:hypothetical protein